MNRRQISVSILLLLSVSCILSCASRYRLDLFLTAEESRKKMKVEGTEYHAGGVINPTSETILQPGPGNCIILTLATRGRSEPTPSYSALWYDEYLTYRVYLQLPPSVAPSTVPLTGNSFVQLLGRYDQPSESKKFLPVSGSLVVDSVTSKHLYGTIDGAFANPANQALNLDGQFKVKIAR